MSWVVHLCHLIPNFLFVGAHHGIRTRKAHVEHLISLKTDDSKSTNVSKKKVFLILGVNISPLRIFSHSVPDPQKPKKFKKFRACWYLCRFALFCFFTLLQPWLFCSSLALTRLEHLVFLRMLELRPNLLLFMCFWVVDSNAPTLQPLKELDNIRKWKSNETKKINNAKGPTSSTSVPMVQYRHWSKVGGLEHFYLNPLKHSCWYLCLCFNPIFEES